MKILFSHSVKNMKGYSLSIQMLCFPDQSVDLQLSNPIPSMYVKYPCTLCYESVAGKLILQTLWLKPKEKRASLFCLSCTSRPICDLCTSAFTWTGSVRIHQCLLHFIYYDSEVFCPVVKPFSSKVFSSPFCLRTVVTLFSDAPSI